MPRHVVITAQGTFADMWAAIPPQPAAVARALDPRKFYWQPLGNYPATVVNPQMGESVKMGVDEMVRLVNTVYTPGNGIGRSFVLLGYSQGALVVGKFWRDECLNPAGRCHNRRFDVVAIAVWGNPMRTPGFHSGNDFAGWPPPGPLDGVVTCGIAGSDCLKPEQLKCQMVNAATVKHFFADFVNTLPGPGNRDLYADCPAGPAVGQPVVDNGPPWANEPPAGSDETLIFDIVQQAFPSLLGIVQKIFSLASPAGFIQLIGIAEAIINGGMFAAAGGNAAHYTYDITPVVNFVALAGTETPAWA